VQFDFDERIPRRGSASFKWDTDADPDMLPMWVADMDFRTAPAVVEALAQRARHGIFGYVDPLEDYYAAINQWFSGRYGFPVHREWVLVTTGVVPAISAILRALVAPGEGVIIQPPVYNCFFSSIRNLQCKTIENNLIYEDGHYSIDFEDLERKAADPANRVLLLCNPHNPAGRAWTRGELERIGCICMAHDVTVVSDEIHCDLVMPGQQHIPYATLGEAFLQGAITCNSPSKSFNLAGLHVANIVVADDSLRRRVSRALNVHEVAEVNPFGVDALIAAYTQGAPWLDELRVYLQGNYQRLVEILGAGMPQLRVVPLEATYLVWVDCRALGRSAEDIARSLREQGKLRINAGTLYGAAGEGFIRINIACPRSLVEEGMARLVCTLGQPA